MTSSRLARTIVVGAVALAAAASSAHAQAQAPEDLKAARELFQEAYKDEQDKRYPEALEKFERVAKVKESASVRYRIATVLTAMGRLREGRDAFRALAGAKSSSKADEREIGDSAAEKVVELDRRIPKLALRVHDNSPPDMRVSVDGAAVPASTTTRAIELDPGEHVVHASGGEGRQSYEKRVTLADDGGETPLVVELGPGDAAKASSSKGVLPWILIGTGGALVLGGGGFLLAREGAISDIEQTCPTDGEGRRVCPGSQRDQVKSDQDRADLFMPLGIGFAVAGAVTAGVGVYLLAKPSSQKGSRSAAPTVGGLRGLRIGAQPVRDGFMLAMGAAL